MENKSVYIIGGGNSLRRFNFKTLKNKTTIAINRAFFFVPNPNYFITVDHSMLNKLNYRERRYLYNTKASKIFVVNLSLDYMKDEKGKIIDSRYNTLYKLHEFNMIIKSYQSQGIGTSFSNFRSGNNSGYCALQLAVLLGFEEINLLTGKKKQKCN